VKTKPSFVEFRPLELQVLISKPRSAKGFPFEFELGSRLLQEMGSSVEGSQNPMTQISTPKFVEEVVAKVLQA
jgi:hypothetical protein